jgi:hypothetical protein
MKMTKVFAVITVVALLSTTSVVAFAASSTPGNSPKERPALTDEQRAERFGGFKNGERPDFGGRGIKGERPEMTDEQKAEMQAKMQEKLAQALAEGKITQEQYDAMINGDMTGFGGRGHGFKGEKPEITDEQKAEFGNGRNGQGFPRGADRPNGRTGNTPSNPR